MRQSGAESLDLLVEGDTQRLPVPDDTFGVVSVAFGLRNVRDTVRGIDEMIRAARPGGKVAILEFSRPRGRVLGRLYLAFFRHILPRVGQAIAPNDDNAYHYLPRTVLEFPDGQDMLDLLASRGLVDLKMHPLTLGIATLYVGTKPARATQPPIGSTLAMNQRAERRPFRALPDLVVAMTGASGAPYAVRLLQTLCKRAGRFIWPSAPAQFKSSARRPGLSFRPIDFDPRSFGDLRPGRVVYHHHRGLLRGDRQRVVSHRRHGGHPVQHEHARGDRPRRHHEPDHPRRRRSPQGTPQADPGPARDAAFA